MLWYNSHVLAVNIPAAHGRLSETAGEEQAARRGENMMSTLTIEYPSEVLWALQQEPQEFEADARLLLAVKLYETGRLSTGMAAKLANVPCSAFRNPRT